ncbi:MAG: phosphotransferase [Gammaproteobacteria bacterium]|nr:phosphotransferase [Gammaproteobacteria bacterium]
MNVKNLEQDASKAMQSWDIDVESVKFITVSENISFHVVSKTGKQYVLRFHRPGYHDYQELISERIWTDDLIATGLDCPVGVKARENQDFVQSRINGQTRYAGVLKWVDGQPLWQVLEDADSHISESVHRFQMIGELVANFHEQAQHWQPPPDFKRPVLDEHGFMGEQPFWGRFWESKDLSKKQQGFLTEIRDACFEILANLSKAPEHYSMIHADLHPGNIIKHGSRLHVIDFDDACFSWHLYDFAVTMLSYTDDENYRSLLDAFFKGYSNLRSLPPKLMPSLNFFYLLRVLAHIGWLADRPELNKYGATQEHMELIESDAEKIIRAYHNA